MNIRALLLASLLLVQPARASDRAFELLVDHLQTHYQKTPMGTGFLGFVARCFSPKGVHGLHMAVFEDLDTGQAPLGADFDTFVRRTVGPDRTPFIHTRGRNGEQVHIYLREKGSQAELLLVSADLHEAVVMNMRLDPERLQEWLADPEGMARKKGYREGN